MRQQFGHIDLLFVPSEICDNGNRTEVLVWDGFLGFVLSLKFSTTQTYTDLGDACGAQADATKCH